MQKSLRSKQVRGDLQEPGHYADYSYENCMLRGERSPEPDFVFMFCFTPAKLWVSECEAPLAIGSDSLGVIGSPRCFRNRLSDASPENPDIGGG